MKIQKYLFLSLGSLMMASIVSCYSEGITQPRTNKPAPVFSKNGSQRSSSPSAQTLARARGLGRDKHGMPTYSDLSTRTRYVRTTAYCHLENEPGAVGKLTAAGTTLRYGRVRSAAADWSVYPLGTTFKIKGDPNTYLVEDYGSALVGTNTIDIFKPTLGAMNKWGVRKIEIRVLKWGSFKRTAKILEGRKKYPHCNKMYQACIRKLNNQVAYNALKNNDAL